MAVIFRPDHVDGFPLGDKENFYLLVLVQGLIAFQVTALGDKGVKSIGHEGGVGRKVPQGKNHLGPIAGFLQELPGYGQDRVFALVDNAAGEFHRYAAGPVSVLPDHDEFSPLGSIDHGDDPGPVGRVYEIESPLPAPVAGFPVALGNVEDAAIGDFLGISFPPPAFLVRLIPFSQALKKIKPGRKFGMYLRQGFFCNLPGGGGQ